MDSRFSNLSTAGLWAAQIRWASVLYLCYGKLLSQQDMTEYCFNSQTQFSSRNPSGILLAISLTIQTVYLRVQSYLISYGVCFWNSHLNVIIAVRNCCVFYDITRMDNVRSCRRDFNLYIVPIPYDVRLQTHPGEQLCKACWSLTKTKARIYTYILSLR